jgi:hypothetical protein
MSMDPGEYRASAAEYREAEISRGTEPALAYHQYLADLEEPDWTAGETWDALWHYPEAGA